MWTKDELKVIVESTKEHFDSDNENRNDAMDFDGNLLVKEDGNTLVYSWDYEEVYFTGTLKECLNYIVGGDEVVYSTKEETIEEPDHSDLGLVKNEDGEWEIDETLL